jgi:hypothetical protein
MSMGAFSVGERPLTDQARTTASATRPSRLRRLVAKADETLTPEAR